jgi:hypothetical protein
MARTELANCFAGPDGPYPIYPGGLRHVNFGQPCLVHGIHSECIALKSSIFVVCGCFRTLLLVTSPSFFPRELPAIWTKGAFTEDKFGCKMLLPKTLP